MPNRHSTNPWADFRRLVEETLQQYPGAIKKDSHGRFSHRSYKKGYCWFVYKGEKVYWLLPTDTGYIVNKKNKRIEKAPIHRDWNDCPGEYLPQPLRKLREWIESGRYTPQELECKLNALTRDGKAWETLDKPNPLKRYEMHHRVLRAVKDRRSEEGREIKPEDKGRFCPVATPDTDNVGFDLRLAYGAAVTTSGQILPSESSFLSLTALMIPFLHFNSPKRSVVACRMMWHVIPMPEGEGEKPRVRTGTEDVAGFDRAGLDALVGFIPWKGRNYEDAIVVSKSFAKRLHIKTGDKICNRHGNKGVAIELPDEELPEVELPNEPERKRLDLLINPCTIKSRSNYGMLLEAHFSMAKGKWQKNITKPFEFDGEDLEKLRHCPGLQGTDGKFSLYQNGKCIGCWPVGYVYTYQLEEKAGDRLLVGSGSMRKDPRGQPRSTAKERAIKIERRMIFALLGRGCDSIVEDLLGHDQVVTKWGRRDLPATTVALLDYLRVLGIRIDFAPNRIQYDILVDDIFVRGDKRTPDDKRQIQSLQDLRDDQHPRGWRYILLPVPVTGAIGEQIQFLPVLPYWYRPSYGDRDNDHFITQRYRDVFSVADKAREILNGLNDNSPKKEMEKMCREVRKRRWLGKNIPLPTNAAALRKYLKKALTNKVRTVFKTLRHEIFKEDGLFQSAMGKRYELSARGIGVPDPTLHMKEVKVPRKVIGQLFPDGHFPKYALVNRNPSISPTCALGFKVRVRNDDSPVIGLHPTVVGAFQGDFDGDEYNLFFPLSDESLTELKQITIRDSLWRESRSKRSKSVLTVKHELAGLELSRDRSVEDIEEMIREKFEKGPTQKGAQRFSGSIWDYNPPIPTQEEWYEQNEIGAKEHRKFLVRGKLGIGRAGRGQELLTEAFFDIKDRKGLQMAMVVGEEINQSCLSANLEEGKDYLQILLNGDHDHLEEAEELMRKADIPQEYIDLILNEIKRTGKGIEALAQDCDHRSVFSAVSAWTSSLKRFNLLRDAAKKCHADRRLYDEYDLKASIMAGYPSRSTQEHGWIGPSRFLDPSGPLPNEDEDKPLVQLIENPDRGRYPIPVMLQEPSWKNLDPKEQRRRLPLVKRAFKIQKEELRKFKDWKARTPSGEVGSLPEIVKKLKRGYQEKSSTQKEGQNDAE